MIHSSLNLLLIVCICLCSFTLAAQGQHKQQTAQIDSLLQEKNSRTGTALKINSQLLQAIKEYSGTKEAATGLEPAKVGADRNGNLLVDISAVVTDDLLGSIRTLGGKIIYPSKRYSTIRAQVHLSVIEKIAAYDEVRFIKPAAVPVTRTS